MNELLNIKDYKIKKIKLPNKIYSWTIILILSLLISIFICYKFKFEYFYHNNSVYKNNKLSFIVYQSDLEKITNNHKIIIDKKEYNYKILEISEPMINNINLEPYFEILIDTKLEDNLKIENNIVKFKIKYDVKDGFEIIKSLILGKGN